MPHYNNMGALCFLVCASICPILGFCQGSLPWCSCCLNFKLGAYVHNGVNFTIITISQKVFMRFQWNFSVMISSWCKCSCDSGSVYYWGFTLVWGWERSVSVMISSRCKCSCDSGSVYYWGLTLVWGWGRSVFKL